jgi:ribosome biogenesis GTPase
MRELGLFADENTDTDDAGFDEITALAENCRFRDCCHVKEPGCAILDALERGDLSAERLEHARKLERELERQQGRHDGLRQRRERLQNRARSIASREFQRRKGGEE